MEVGQDLEGGFGRGEERGEEAHGGWALGGGLAVRRRLVWDVGLGCVALMKVCRYTGIRSNPLSSTVQNTTRKKKSFLTYHVPIQQRNPPNILRKLSHPAPNTSATAILTSPQLALSRTHAVALLRPAPILKRRPSQHQAAPSSRLTMPYTPLLCLTCGAVVGRGCVCGCFDVRCWRN